MNVQHSRLWGWRSGLCLVLALGVMQPAFGHRGTVTKYLQRPGYLVDPDNMQLSGENIPSDIDWHKVMQSPTIEPNWIIADDFKDDFSTPVLTVRWWGSYRPGFEPDPRPGIPPVPFEDGFVLSFFSDEPMTPTNGFSRPKELLGTYVAPMPAVRMRPTTHLGWDNHRIWEYEVDLQDTCLDHQTAWTTPNGFHQKPGEVYWLAINAEVGHGLEAIRDPATGEVIRWEAFDTGKQASQHFWGWHTSPDHFNDVATMGHLAMPTADQWQFGQWEKIRPQHGLHDMAFQLLTVPEPCNLLLGGLSVLGLCSLRRRQLV